MILIILTTLSSIIIGGLFFLFQPVLLQSNKNKDDDGIELSPPAPPKETQQERPLLTLVIPAYNEVERLPPMLETTLSYLQKERYSIVSSCQKCLSLFEKKQQTKSSVSPEFEIVIVDDGSTDGTSELILQSYKNNNSIRIIQLPQNSGKGAAVRTGMLRSNGRFRLMIDADGATDISDGLPKVLDAMYDKLQSSSSSSSSSSGGSSLPPVVIFGSRAHLQEDDTVQRTLVRTVLMHAFHFFVRTICSVTLIQDTQCGFKLFTESCSRLLFRELYLKRWAFDIELVVRSDILRGRGDFVGMEEVGVSWREVEGSKLDDGRSKLKLLWVSLGMLRDMLCVRIAYGLGIWVAGTYESLDTFDALLLSGH